MAVRLDLYISMNVPNSQDTQSPARLQLLSDLCGRLCDLFF